MNSAITVNNLIAKFGEQKHSKRPPTKFHEAVFYCILQHGPITQKQIAASERWFGCHPVHERHLLLRDQAETTRRHIRKILFELRNVYGIPILKGANGHWLPTGKDDAQAFIDALARETKSRNESHIKTYRSMSALLGVQSAYMDALAEQVLLPV